MSDGLAIGKWPADAWERIFGRPKLVRIEFDEVDVEDQPNRDNNKNNK